MGRRLLRGHRSWSRKASDNPEKEKEKKQAVPAGAMAVLGVIQGIYRARRADQPG
jgi:hypothetical protein